MKILLVAPPFANSRAIRSNVRLPSLGLAYLAAMLEGGGHRVKIIDAGNLGWSWSFLAAEIKRQKADLIGVGSYTQNRDRTFRAMTICRPHARYLVMGGQYVSGRRQEIFKECPELDFGIAGEAEISLPALVKKLERGTDPGDVPGLVTPDRFNPPGSFIEDLDSLPFPARRLLPNDLYYHGLWPGKKTTSLLTSRGCPYRCTYCDRSISGSTWRARSPQNVLDEIEEVVRDLDIHAFAIADEIFTFDSRRVREICQGILDRDLDVQWKCETRADLVDEETLCIMKKAGCSIITYRIESGNQETLDHLKKGFTLPQVRQAVAMARRAGIATMAHFLLGIPVETFAQAMKTIEFARELNADFPNFAFLSPIRGTEFCEEAEVRGWNRHLEVLGLPVAISENWPVEALEEIITIAGREFTKLRQRARESQKK